jgi:hypothetical protein
MTRKNTPHPVGLLWKRDQPVTESSTWQHKHSTETDKLSLAGLEPVDPATLLAQNRVLDHIAFEIG